MKVAVLGAGGYIGGLLVKLLLAESFEVTVLTRNIADLRDRPWFCEVTSFEAELPDSESVREALRGVDVAYYLAHSLESDSYVQTELSNAKAFASACETVEQIIYMGGMPTKGGMSKHILAKRAVAQLLRKGAPTLEIAAGPVIGSGSASYELLRDLVQRLPILLAGKWGNSRLSIIGIDDLISCLVNGAKFRVVGEARVGTDPMKVCDLIDTFAEVNGRSIRCTRSMFIGWRVAAEISNLLSSVSRKVIYHLFESLPFDSLGPNELGRDLIRGPFQSAKGVIASAVADDRQGLTETRWTDGESAAFDYKLTEEKGAFRETIIRTTSCSARALYTEILRLGGQQGWGRLTWLWRLRGAFDKVIGGPGDRRGRRNANSLRTGESLDWWRVRQLERDRRVFLEAEMILPGRGYLVFDVAEDGGRTTLTQTAIFVPKGILGWLYWWLSYPFHKLVFPDLIGRIIHNAETRSQSTPCRSSS